MTKFYPTVGQKVYLKNKGKKGIVKAINPDANRTKVTYFDKEDKRKTVWMFNKTLAPWNPKTKSASEVIEGQKKFMSEMKNAGLFTVAENTAQKTSFGQVREFQKAFNLPAPDVPTILTPEQVINRSAWTVEEIIELLWATAENERQFADMFIELVERMEKSFHKLIVKPFEPHNKLVNQVDALVDQLYFVNGSMVEQGVVPDPITAIVHNANMAKLVNGKPLYNEEGKVQKPDGWVAPEALIEVEVKRQVELGAKRFN